MSIGISDPNNKEIIRDYYRSALDESSWQSSKPVFDLSNLFSIRVFRHHFGHALTKSPILEVIRDVVKDKYPAMPDSFAIGINAHYVQTELHPFPFELTEGQIDSIKRYLQQKLDNTNSFPFPKIMPARWRIVEETRFGIRAFAHDIYQPILMQHRTRPLSFRDRTVGVLMQCPTTVYDLPENMSKEFPVSFLLCNPYFTMPRFVPAYLGGHVNRLSLFDMFSSDHAEMAAAKSDTENLVENIELMYDDAQLVETAAKLARRAVLTSGGTDRMKPAIDFADRQEWLLAKEMFRQKLCGPHAVQATLRFNIMEARTEATKREREEKMQEAEERKLSLQKDINLIKQEGG